MMSINLKTKDKKYVPFLKKPNIYGIWHLELFHVFMNIFVYFNFFVKAMHSRVKLLIYEADEFQALPLED